MKPELEDLMTTSDIGRRLGITRQGAHFLTLSRTDFPSPIGKKGHYMLWWAPDIDSWISRQARDFTPPKRPHRIPASLPHG